MRDKLRRAAERAAENPVLRKSAQSMKPGTGIWGVVGVLLFFIIPEIVAFGYGGEIAAWAHSAYLTEPVRVNALLYRLLEMLFEDGGSWLNLSVGIALLIWIVFERKKKSC